MKLHSLAWIAAVPLAAFAAQPWQEITTPTAAQAAAGFAQPPAEYGAIHWAIWGGPQTKERILADIERIAANGGGEYMINNSRGVRPKYFTPEYLDLVKYTVEQCKQHGLKVWIEDDAGYPSGMAGGLIRSRYPQLGMQGIVADTRYTVAAGQTLRVPPPPHTLGILAYNRSGRTSQVLPLPANGELVWTAPDPGLSEVVFVRHVYRSSPTRYTNREDGTNDKDSLYTLIDYLDPGATRVYLNLIHETYAKVVGDEFGKTILGFRGDEPDYTGFMPWTPKLLEIFRREKGYDLQPYLAQFFGVVLSPEAKRAKADYWDVWSALFRDAFFKPQAEWCGAHGMEYMVHLNHEELMLDLGRGEDLIRNEGSFFRDMRFVGVPGIDNLNQIQPGIVADFPKLAADAAHVYGRPHVWTEEGGSVGAAGKFVADYQLVRGVNYLNIRGINLEPAEGALENRAAAMAHYVSRAGYLLSIGRPAAQVALYHPTDSLWLGDEQADMATVKLTSDLMEHQIDFDAIDADALTSVCTLADGGLKNLSGQVYRAVVIPSCTAISEAMLERLKAFAAAGGKVIFAGRTPSLVYGRTFLHAEAKAPDLSFAALIARKPAVTDRMVELLPRDVALDHPAPAVKYIHRVLADADVYFFFNESDQPQSANATLAGRGRVQVWDAASGTIQPLAELAAADGHATVPLALAPHESRFLVIGALPPAAAGEAPTFASSEAVMTLDGPWEVTVGEKKASALEPWSKLGVGSFGGIAEYRKTFTAPQSTAGRRVYLDLGQVDEVAAVELNGKPLGAHGWAPYAWDVTEALKSGENTLVVKVQVPTEARRGFGSFGGRRGAPAEPRPEVTPTGVPGGLATDATNYIQRLDVIRNIPAGLGTGPAGRGGRAAGEAPPRVTGLLGPVRLLTP